MTESSKKITVTVYKLGIAGWVISKDPRLCGLKDPYAKESSYSFFPPSDSSNQKIIQRTGQITKSELKRLKKNSSSESEWAEATWTFFLSEEQKKKKKEEQEKLDIIYKNLTGE